MITNSSLLGRTTLLGTSLFIPATFGAGFQLAERSAAGLGRAFSGEASVADDASVLSSNPAAMILLGGDWNYSAGMTYIEPGADATLYPTVTGGNARPALRDNDIAESAFVPYLYATKRLNEDLVIGAGMFTSYGLRTNYSENVASQVGTNYSEVTTVNFNPSIGYRINDVVSIGAGFNILYAEGEITSSEVTLAGAPSFGLEGDDWSFGWNLGVLFELSEKTRVGIHYRSALNLELEGTATGSIIGLAGLASSDASLDVELPATAEISISHDLNSQWTLHGDVFWTQWSAFERLEPTVSTGIPAANAMINPVLATEQDWSDTFRYSIGTTYRHDETWTFRGGIAYDESPIDDSKRTLRIPDGDRIWLSLGASYVVNEHLTIDAGYSYIFVDEVSLGQNDNGLIDTDSIGEGNIQVFSLGVSGSF